MPVPDKNDLGLVFTILRHLQSSGLEAHILSSSVKGTKRLLDIVAQGENARYVSLSLRDCLAPKLPPIARFTDEEGSLEIHDDTYIMQPFRIESDKIVVNLVINYGRKEDVYAQRYAEDH